MYEHFTKCVSVLPACSRRVRADTSQKLKRVLALRVMETMVKDAARRNLLTNIVQLESEVRQKTIQIAPGPKAKHA